MTISMRPLSGGWGQEVLNVDLSSELAESEFRQIETAWQEDGIVVLRRQLLDEEDLIRFAARLGELEVLGGAAKLSPYHPEICYISNLRNHAGDPIGGLGYGEVTWHSDQTYRIRPATGSILYGIVVPPEGGETHLADQCRAYESLPEEIRDKIDGATGVFSYAPTVSKYFSDEDVEEILGRTPDVTRPIVLAHPVTGRKALYADPTGLVRIRDFERAESDRIRAILTKHATDPAIVYRHKWNTGDVLMWDNGRTLHRRTPMKSELAIRLMKRATVFLPTDRYIVPPNGTVASAAPEAVR